MMLSKVVHDMGPRDALLQVSDVVTMMMQSNFRNPERLFLLLVIVFIIL